MSDLTNRLRGYAYGLTWGEKAQTGALSNDLRAAADALDRAEAERDTARHDFEAAELARAGAEVIAAAARPLATFGLAVLVEMRVDGGGDIDGGWAQDAAEKCGVIEPHEVTEPCRPEGCYCAEYGFPCICYRDSEAVKAYRALVAACEK